MPRKNWPPRRVDYALVDELRRALLEQYRQTHLEMRQAEDAYDGRLPLGINLPAAIPRHIPATAMSKVDSAVAHIVTDFPTPDIKPPGSGARASDRKVALDGLASYLLQRVQTEFDEDIFGAAKFDAVSLGAFCVKACFDEDAWPEPPDNAAEMKEWRRCRKTAFPFHLRTINPRQVLVPRNGRWPHTYAIELQERYAVDLWQDYPRWRDPLRGRDPMRKVEWLEYWDADNYVCFADGLDLFRRKNPHGVVPYVWQPVARGRRDSRPKGLLGGAVYSQLQAQARAMTALDVLWQFMVFPRLMVDKDEARQVEMAWNTGPGGLIPVEHVFGENRSVDWLDMPQLNGAMFEFLPTIAQQITNATFDDALTGERPTGVDYGIHQALLIGQARQALRPFVSALNRGVSNLVNLLFMYVENVLDESLLIDGRTEVGPRQINGHYQAQVTFEAINEADDDRRAQLGIQVLGSGAESHRTVLGKYFKHLNPDEELTEIMAELVVKQLVESGTMARVVMQSANFDEATEQLNAEIQQLSASMRPAAPQSRSAPFGELGGRLQTGETMPLQTRGEGVYQ